METPDHQPAGAEAQPGADHTLPAPPTGLVRTRSGRLVRAEPAPAALKTAQDAAPWSRPKVLVLVAVVTVLLGFLVFLGAGSGGGERGALTSILKDVGYVIRQQKGPGITR